MRLCLVSAGKVIRPKAIIVLKNVFPVVLFFSRKVLFMRYVFGRGQKSFMGEGGHSAIKMDNSKTHFRKNHGDLTVSKFCDQVSLLLTKITLCDVCSIHRGDTMSILGGYHEYIGGV